VLAILEAHGRELVKAQAEVTTRFSEQLAKSLLGSVTPGRRREGNAE
jgi:hypothetical protein